MTPWISVSPPVRRRGLKRSRDDRPPHVRPVASRAEARIETWTARGGIETATTSPPVRRRGLKRPGRPTSPRSAPSPPVRRRGLKRHRGGRRDGPVDVASRAEARIETSWGSTYPVAGRWSPPVRRRGLKPGSSAARCGSRAASPPVRRRGLKLSVERENLEAL